MLPRLRREIENPERDLNSVGEILAPYFQEVDDFPWGTGPPDARFRASAHRGKSNFSYENRASEAPRTRFSIGKTGFGPYERSLLPFGKRAFPL